MRSAANVASASSMACAGSDSPTWPAASMPSSSRRSTVSVLAVLGLGDRVVGVGDPERELGLVGGGREDEHLGAADLVAEGLAQEGGVDRFGGDDEQFHAVGATPAGGAENPAEVERSVEKPKRCSPWPAPGARVVVLAEAAALDGVARRAAASRSASSSAPSARRPPASSQAVFIQAAPRQCGRR